jgi:subtilisin family serine protease
MVWMMYNYQGGLFMNRPFMCLFIILTAAIISLAPQTSHADMTETYVVLYKMHAVPADAASKIAHAGGTLVYSYDQIGVAIADSDDALFRDKIMRDKRIENASSTEGFDVTIDEGTEFEAVGVQATELTDSGPYTGDPLSPLQWDMRQISVPEAHAITEGDPSVIVGDIDTGIDYTHPDLAPNIDFDKSVSCIGGVPDQNPAAWMDNHFHGTHTAGTIAAAANGIGIIGVAPNVKIAAIKGCTDRGYCWPEDIICSFMWAAENDIDVTNNSYYVDPYTFNCRNDPNQRAIWKAIQRVVRYAQSKGVTVVTAAGNENLDLAHPPEEITNSCVALPVELSGVIGVSSNGNLMQKSYYSSYGVGTVDVVAPGGDVMFQRTDEAPVGAVLSTIPVRYGSYGYGQGTSMASPHAAGVAALIISKYGKMPPGKVQAMLIQSADPQPCPSNPFVPGGNELLTAYCQGGEGYNSFYGHGQVNAYNAVTSRAGNK